MEDLNFLPVLIPEVFSSMASSSAWYDKSKLDPGEPVFPFVSRTQSSNGVEGFCAQQVKAPEAGNALTIGLDTQTLGYQPVPFYTGQNIQVLRHPRLNHWNAMVLIALIREQMAKFSWGGNGATLGRLKKTRIMVPAVSLEEDALTVDWDAMDRLGEQVLRTARSRAEHTIGATTAVPALLPELDFVPFDVLAIDGRDGIFRAHKGKRLIAAHRKPGDVPFVGAARTKNSIVDFAEVDQRFPAGWVTLVYNGDGGTGHAKYQPAPFNASDDVIVLEPISEETTEASLLMLVTMLTQQCVSKFSFGYKLTLHRLSRQKIMVPVVSDGQGHVTVDWAGMDAYGRALRSRTEKQLHPVVKILDHL